MLTIKDSVKKLIHKVLQPRYMEKKPTTTIDGDIASIPTHPIYFSESGNIVSGYLVDFPTPPIRR